MTASAWQRELSLAITQPDALLAQLGLDPGLLPGARAGASLFRLRVTPSFLARMRRGDLRHFLQRAFDGFKTFARSALACS